MDSEKYIGLDVHQATIVVAVTDSTGKLVMLGSDRDTGWGRRVYSSRKSGRWKASKDSVLACSFREFLKVHVGRDRLFSML